ncbi:MAG: DUF5011 domain-containing protein [Clostridia bacterium]|nr:DUF5011 domain-containing protein [Clostridia bacterium]
MSEKGSITRETKTARINFPSGKSGGNLGNNSKKQFKNAWSTFGIIGIILLVCVLAGGILVGSVACYFACQNDCFKLNGDKEVELYVGQTYNDPGCTVIEFGQDISDKVVRSGSFMELTDGTSQTEGSFYIKYTVDTFKYGKLFTIYMGRIITFVAPSESDDVVEFYLEAGDKIATSVGESYSESVVKHCVYNEDTEEWSKEDITTVEIIYPENFLDEGNKIKSAGTFEIIYKFTLNGVEQQLVQTVQVAEGGA